MNSSNQHETTPTYEPPRPTWMATGILSLWIALLSWPIWTGKFLATIVSDQYKAGYGFRSWAAEQWKTNGSIPLWNPEIFGGMPFVAGMHGDIFYPTAWLRLIMPIHVAMNIGFVVHYVLAGLFAYLLLRRLKVSWSGAIVGGLGYQLSGVIASYVNPGHDGKLFVTALLPLALIALIDALRDRKWEGYAVFALAVGLGFLSPHPQLLYYMLVTTGLFALYLTFGDRSDEALQPRLLRLGIALGAVFVGFGIGAIQMVPFYYYIPFSPRAETIGGWERATQYAIPWAHIPEFFLSRFAGQGTIDGSTYWGSNGIKFHSEYLGLPLVALAVLGATGPGRRRLKWWMGGIGLLFLLVGMGAATPFYRVWYSVMPFMKQVWAAGMALYIVALVVAILAGLGIERLLQREGKTHAKVWLGTGAVLVVVALSGMLGTIAENLASPLQRGAGMPTSAQIATAASPAIRIGALTSAFMLIALGAAAWLFHEKKVNLKVAAFLMITIVGSDLWLNARTFWNYSDASTEIFGGDEITEYLQSLDKPLRVFHRGVYPSTAIGTVLMAYQIPELLGHHGNELHAFDQLMGGQDIWQNVFTYGGKNFSLFDLYGVRYAVLPSGQGVDSIPGFTRIMTNVSSAGGGVANLFERDTTVVYARLVPVAVEVPAEQIVATVVNDRFPMDRVVLVDSTAGIDAPLLDSIPDPIPIDIAITEWIPGHMRLELGSPAPRDALVLVSENWYPDWRATVDGAPADVVRGNGSLITVPVSAGAQTVTLDFVSDAYKLGKIITWISVVVVLLGVAAPIAVRRRSG